MKSSLVQSVVIMLRCIYEDRGKNLWFGTIDGLNLYDPAKDNFKVFKNNPADTNSINSNYISSIIEDKKGNLWIVSFIRGIHRFDPETGKFTNYDDSSIDFGANCYKSLYIDNHDKIWITTDGSGFFSYDPVTDKFEQFRSRGDGKGPNQNRILDIIPEDDRHLLLGVDQGGINRFDKVSKTFEYIKYDLTNDEGLNNNGIWCLFKDREGILWVGTSGGGINYYNPKKENFKLFRPRKH